MYCTPVIVLPDCKRQHCGRNGAVVLRGIFVGCDYQEGGYFMSHVHFQ
jgi:hypothetical protein